MYNSGAALLVTESVWDCVRKAEQIVQVIYGWRKVVKNNESFVV